MCIRDSTWLDDQTTSAPTDLLAYQELISRVRPDWIVETGTSDPGRTAFVAAMCELVGPGRVVSVGPEPIDERIDHPRVDHVVGRPQDDDVAAAVTALVGDGRALVILGSCTDRHKTALEFAAYSPLVPVDSYVVITDTIVNGHPVWTGFGPGPAEAVKQILTRYGDFVQDPAPEKYSLSFNPGGYLRRVR